VRSLRGKGKIPKEREKAGQAAFLAAEKKRGKPGWRSFLKEGSTGKKNRRPRMSDEKKSLPSPIRKKEEKNIRETWIIARGGKKKSNSPTTREKKGGVEIGCGKEALV